MKKILWSLAILLFLQPLNQLKAGDPDWLCTKDPISVPGGLAAYYPLLKYLGKAPDSSPVFLNEKTQTIYIFDKDFKNQPKYIFWNGTTDLRTTIPCTNEIDPYWSMNHQGIYPVPNCPWSKVNAKGLKSFLNSMHINCNGGYFDSFGVNKNITKANPGACIGIRSALNANKPMSTCCKGFDYNNNTGKCDVPFLRDLKMGVCANNSDCADSRGCFPKRAKDMFLDNDQASLRTLLATEQKIWTNKQPPKMNGAACDHAYECESYLCEGKKCTIEKTCRHGDVAEYVPGAIKCMKGLNKDASMKCEDGPGYGPFLGAEDQFKFEQDGEWGFNISDEQKHRANEAMRMLKGLEWLASINDRDPDKADCFKFAGFLKEVVSKPVIETKKQILVAYNKEYKAIETDYNNLKKAGEYTALKEKKGGDEILTMYTFGGQRGEKITLEELALRMSSGNDSLMVMRNRNELFLAYESAMMNIYNTIAEKLLDFDLRIRGWKKDGKNYKGWGDYDKYWEYPAPQSIVSAYHCEAWYTEGGGWFSSDENIYHDQTRDRWQTYYSVDMSKDENKSVFASDFVTLPLALIHGLLPEELPVLTDYMKNHKLMDPINYDLNKEQYSFAKFGTSKKIAEDHNWYDSWSDFGNSIFGGGITERRYFRELNGGQASYQSIRAAFREGINDYYKKFNPDQTPDFIYEPDLVNDSKDCPYNLNKDSCKSGPNNYVEFLDQITDQTFAQYLAFGVNDTATYSYYFKNPDKGRTRLTATWAVESNALSSYYKELVERRTKQIEGINKVLTKMNKDDDHDRERGGGIELDNGNYLNKDKNPNLASDGHSGKSLKGNTVNTSHSAGIKGLNFLLGNKHFGSGSTSFDTVASNGSSFSKAGSIGDTSTVAAAITKRMAHMKSVNELAKSRGIDVAGKEAKRKSVFTALSGNKSGAGLLGARSGPGTGLSGNGSGNHSGKSSIDAEKNAPNGGLNPAGALANEGGNGDAGGKMEALSGHGGGPYSSSGDSSGAYGRKDGTGMSDEEKDAMMANYDRNKSKYNPDEYDGLFHIVSKAYVRNLDKVLIKKKKEGP